MRLFRRDDADGDGVADAEERGGVATRTRPAPAGRRAGGVPAWGRGDAVTARDADLRRRDEFGGMNLGAAFFGWLVAIGMAVIVTSILAAAGAAIGLTNGADAGDADTITIVGGALLVATLMLAYFCGGYVAGRMSRFDGGRQGFGTWLVGLLITLLIAGAGAAFGSEYNVFSKLDLPRIPVDEGSLATGGAIALAAVVLGTLLAAIVGGMTGQRYHTRVDRAGLVDH
jgi:amino acid transporter